MAEIVVRLLAGDDEEKSFFLSREFSSDVARLSGVVSHAPPSASPGPGKRGDPITLGPSSSRLFPAAERSRPSSAPSAHILRATGGPK